MNFSQSELARTEVETEIENNDEFIWVIKNQDGNFVNRNSIRKSYDSSNPSNNHWIYISFKTFSEECRGYTNKDQAKKALEELNKSNIHPRFETTFYLECNNFKDIIIKHKEFSDNNIVICETTSKSEFSLVKAI